MPDPTKLVTYTVYRKPLDYPDDFVVRRFQVVAGAVKPDAEPWYFGKSLNDARQSIPSGLVCILRNEEDDPCIIETWL